jgi:hypothetical protein
MEYIKVDKHGSGTPVGLTQSFVELSQSVYTIFGVVAGNTM